MSIDLYKKMQRELDDSRVKKEKALAVIEERERNKKLKEASEVGRNSSSISTETHAQENLRPKPEKTKNIKEKKPSVLVDAFKSFSLLIFTRMGFAISTLVVPYIVGSLVLVLACFLVVDVSLSTYVAVMEESFSTIGIWGIGYFVVSTIMLLFTLVLFIAEYQDVIRKRKKQNSFL